MLPLQQQLHERLVKNNREVLEVLVKVFRQNPDNQKLVRVLQAELEGLRRQQIAGSMPHDEEARRFSQINTRILELIDMISEEEAAAHELEHAIFQRILVVCRRPDRHDYMRRLLPDTVYKGLHLYEGAERMAPDAVQGYDLVVYDNDQAPDTSDDLHYYLQHAQYFLFFGTAHVKELRDYPDKAYFANAPFSIHARLDEMIRYVRYTRG